MMNLMMPLKARVQNGRLVLDEPTDLPEGEVVYLVPAVADCQGDELDDEERAALHLSLAESVADIKAGRVFAAEDVMAELRNLASK